MDSGPRDFERAALVWDEQPGHIRLAADLATRIRETIPLNPSMRMLDFGCGTGLLTLTLARDIAGATGADSSPGMLAVLQAKCHAQGIENVDIRLINNETGLDFPGTFDLVVSSMTFHHVKDVPQILSQMHARTVPGGYIAIADLDPEKGLFHDDPAGVYHHGFERFALQKMLLEAGYLEVASRDAAVIQKLGSDLMVRKFQVFLITGLKAI